MQSWLRDCKLIMPMWNDRIPIQKEHMNCIAYFTLDTNDFSYKSSSCIRVTRHKFQEEWPISWVHIGCWFLTKSNQVVNLHIAICAFLFPKAHHCECEFEIVRASYIPCAIHFILWVNERECKLPSGFRYISTTHWIQWRTWTENTHCNADQIYSGFHW